METLRTRIVEKCWPQSLIGQTLTLGTTSPLTRSEVSDRPRVKEALEKCLATHFKEPFFVEMAVAGGTEPAEEAPQVESPPPVMPATEPPPPPEPPRDLIGDRMRQVFQSSEEIM